MARRRVEEFWCSTGGGGCGKYFQTYLRDNMFGNYTMQCPACGHHHFRVVKEGHVTDDRHHERYGQAEVIVGLKATLSDVPWTQKDPNFKRAQLTAYSGGKQ